MAMDCQIIRSAMLPMLVLLHFGPMAGAQESAATLDSVLQRLDRVERDNQMLREKVARFEEPAINDEVPSRPDDGLGESAASYTSDGERSGGWIYQPVAPQYLFASGEPSPLLSESDVRTIVSQVVDEKSKIEPTAKPGSPEDMAQNKRLTELDKALKAFTDKANTKTYPSVTVNGVFQVDSGWIHQDSVSRAQYGHILDGTDFRRARLSAKGSVTETTNYFFQMDFGFFGRPTFTDVWVEQTKVPLFGNVRIGQWGVAILTGALCGDWVNCKAVRKLWLRA